MLYLTNLLLLLLTINNADLEEWLERQCRPKIKLGRQKFRRPTAGRGQHFVTTFSLWIQRAGALPRGAYNWRAFCVSN